MTKSIPLSVRNLLTDHRQYTPGSLDRYLHRPEDRGPRSGLTWVEARDLVADGVIDNDWIGPGCAVAVTGDQHRAVCAFRDEVFEAWERLQAKLDKGRNRRSRRPEATVVPSRFSRAPASVWSDSRYSARFAQLARRIPPASQLLLGSATQ